MEKCIGAFNEDLPNCWTAKKKKVLQWCPPDLGYLSGLQMYQFSLQVWVLAFLNMADLASCLS